MAIKHIGFIGGGNMASCIIQGLLANGTPPEHIHASDPSEEKSQALHQRFHIHSSTSNKDISNESDILIFAVKPQIMENVISELADIIQQKKILVISIATGISTHTMQQLLKHDAAIVRVMPNTPALVNSGMSVLFANDTTSQQQRETAEHIFRSVGQALWVHQESSIDTATAISGSGPAYFFWLMETMEAQAKTFGFSDTDARLLVAQTAIGASKLALESNVSFAELRKQVTSPNGTTAAALDTLANEKTADSFQEAMHAAYKRAIELSKSE